jgi:hypothetical protein
LFEPDPSTVAVTEGKARLIVFYESKEDNPPYYLQAALKKSNDFT